MKINYLTIATEDMPSVRYRMKMPGEYIGDYEITSEPVDADIYVFSKPYTKDVKQLRYIADMAMARPYVYDICDDMFLKGGAVAEFHREMIIGAGAVTVTSSVMKNRVNEETGVNAVIIEDPVEFERGEIKSISDPKVMWFGTPVNLKTIDFKDFPYELEVVTTDRADVRRFLDSVNYDVKFTEWSIDAMKEAFKRNNIVIVPSTTEKFMQAKSANRVANAIYAGLSVVASPIPAYEQFSEYITLEWDVSAMRVKQVTTEAQDYVDSKFNISVIGEKWKTLFDSILGVDEESLMAG
jgi:hypothetical protein